MENMCIFDASKMTPYIKEYLQLCKNYNIEYISIIDLLNKIKYF